MKNIFCLFKVISYVISFDFEFSSEKICLTKVLIGDLYYNFFHLIWIMKCCMTYCMTNDMPV